MILYWWLLIIFVYKAVLVSEGRVRFDFWVSALDADQLLCRGQVTQAEMCRWFAAMFFKLVWHKAQISLWDLLQSLCESAKAWVRWTQFTTSFTLNGPLNEHSIVFSPTY